MRISDWSSDVCSSDLEAMGVRRVGTFPPESADRPASLGGQGEQPSAGLPPNGRSLITAVLLLAGPPFGTPRHFLLDAVLPGGDYVGEQRQRLALASLLGEKRRALARRFFILLGPGPFAEAHGSALPLDDRKSTRLNSSH